MKQTIKNLAAAFVGESQARNRYTFYSKIAAKEGYIKISQIFALTADQEREHANWLFKLIQEFKKEEDIPVIKVDAEVPTVRGTTIENLKAAIAGENYEHTSMYPEFAQVAKDEGYEEIGRRLLAIAKAEEHHKQRFEGVLKVLEDGTIFKKEEQRWWVCIECGYAHFGTEPPEICPSCGHPRAYYELKCEEY